jgi:hypothetical protein
MKVYVTENFASMELEVFVYRDVSDAYYEVLQIMPGGAKTWVRQDRNVMSSARVVNPTYLIDRNVARHLIVALAEHGVKVPDQSKVEGLYEAQTKHLVDLQKVLQTCLDKVRTE